MSYGIQEKESLGTLSSCEEPTKDRLERLRKHLQGRISDIDEALALLAKYPDMEKLTDLLRKI